MLVERTLETKKSRKKSVSKTPLTIVPPRIVCPLCHGCLATHDTSAVYYTAKKGDVDKKIAAHYYCLHELKKTPNSYFGDVKLSAAMPKNYSLGDYFIDLKEVLLPNQIGNPKVERTLKIIQALFFEGFHESFVKIFFIAKKNHVNIKKKVDEKIVKEIKTIFH